MPFIENLTHTDPYEVESPVECYKLRIIGIYCTILFISSLVLNSLLLWVFLRYKELRTSLNTFIFALTILNLFGTIVELPFVISSNFYCRWMFHKWGCVFSAFVMYFIGCSSIYLMTLISFERFYIIYKPLSIRHINFKLCFIGISACLLIGLFWSLIPVFGWSYYSLEGAYTSCAVEWKERSFSVTSYNITIFAVVYLIPLSVMVFTNIKLIFIIKRLPKIIQSNNLNQDNKNKKRIASERNLTIVIMLLIAGFIMSWTPYAVVALYSAFINPEGVSPLMGTIPAIIAKSSMLWTSVLYIFSNRQIRKRLVKSLQPFKKSTSSLSKSREKSINEIKAENNLNNKADNKNDNDIENGIGNGDHVNDFTNKIDRKANYEVNLKENSF